MSEFMGAFVRESRSFTAPRVSGTTAACLGLYSPLIGDYKAGP